MRKFGFLAVTALTVAALAGWVVSTTQAPMAAPVNGAQIDVRQIMTAATEMPTHHFVDYSFVFEK